MADIDRPLRILHLTAGSDAGGVSRYLRDLCDALARAGHDVKVAGERGAWHDHFAQCDWPWIEQPLKAGWFALKRAGNQLAQQPYDLVHAHFRKAAVAARVIAKSQQIPMLFTLHLTGIPMSGPWRWLTDFGDHTHVPSATAKQWLIDEAKLSADRITVIPHGLDSSWFPLADDATQQEARQSLGLPPDATIAAFVGRFDDPKNEQWMIDLAEAASDRLPDLHVLMVGEGPREAQLHQRIAESPASDRVTVLDYRDPLPAYQACDALLLPSSLEGFSYVCVEAMSVGRPVLRTRTAGTEEMIEPNLTGESTDINREAFVESAIRFLADRNCLREMGSHAATHVRAKLTFDRQVQQTLTLYNRLIGNS